jgi:CheY-like chemotaxis protein
MSKPLAFVIDDDKSLGEAYRTALELSGFEAQYISDSEQAMALISEKLPIVVMLDLQMPKVSGLDILRAIRADDRTRHIKVIVATANHFILQHENVDDIADLVLSKPVSLSQIRHFAARMIGAD